MIATGVFSKFLRIHWSYQWKINSDLQKDSFWKTSFNYHKIKCMLRKIALQKPVQTDYQSE